VYCPQLAPGGNTLSVEEAHHVVRVLRLRTGDGVVLFDGSGGEAQGRILRIRGQSVEVDAAAVVARPFETIHRITLAVALAKTHRHAYLVEKCTELGVAGFWPIVAGRSVTRPGEFAVEKWSRRAVEAAKQSGRAWVPTFHRPLPLDDAITRIGEFDAAALADPQAQSALTAFLSAQRTGANILVFVGPEGGFEPAEHEVITAAGARPVRLAPTILRTETAAVGVCAAEAGLPSG
jgi:16S rRNA (uracil1498-N3)-methyltransferase